MTSNFSPEDFEPLDMQTLALLFSCEENSSEFSSLKQVLTSIHTELSSLITQAENENSILRKRCSDRHGDWLQIRYDLQNTLCETQDLVDLYIQMAEDDWEVVESEEDSSITQRREELRVHDDVLNDFIVSLGLSKLARSDPVLGEIERILLVGAREERERSPERVSKTIEENRLGGREGVTRLLRNCGIDKAALNTYDTRIKQLVLWVLKNEPELTAIHDLNDLADKLMTDKERPKDEDEDEDEEGIGGFF
jgi:hypothetical protein